MKTGNNKMKTELTLASKEHASNWQEVTLARIVRNKRTFVLLDLAGNVIAKSSELMTVTPPNPQTGCLKSTGSLPPKGKKMLTPN